MQVKVLPNRPTRFCRKKTGPGDDHFIRIPSNGVSQLNMPTITISETATSKQRLTAKYTLR